jgi:hypothetical protein
MAMLLTLKQLYDFARQHANEEFLMDSPGE